MAHLTPIAGDLHSVECKKITVDARHAKALVVGSAGATNPAFQVDSSTASAATGVKVTAAAPAGGVAIAAISSGTDESVTLDAKGAGAVTVAATSTGGANVYGLRVTATSTNPVTGAATVSIRDSGAALAVQQSGGGYTITLPLASAMSGCRFTFFVTATAAGTTVITNAAGFRGTIVNDVTSVISVNGTTNMNFVGGAAAVGDSIEVFGISPTLIGVRAVTSAAGGITTS